jgi:hypothetical protein
MADIKRREFITLLGGAAHGLLRRARNRTMPVSAFSVL